MKVLVSLVVALAGFAVGLAATFFALSHALAPASGSSSVGHGPAYMAFGLSFVLGPLVGLVCTALALMLLQRWRARHERIAQRPATQDDLPFLFRLRRATMETHMRASGVDTSDDAHRARILHGFEHARILERDGAPIGLLKLHRGEHGWDLLQIQLDPTLHGQGVGRRILEDILAEADAARVAVTLGVLKANPARRLYERLGFVQVGEDAHEYRMRRDPVAT
jgi:ribosomal protein S18 acetylase RimI-like enzyme